MNLSAILVSILNFLMDERLVRGCILISFLLIVLGMFSWYGADDKKQVMQRFTHWIAGILLFISTPYLTAKILNINYTKGEDGKPINYATYWSQQQSAQRHNSANSDNSDTQAGLLTPEQYESLSSSERIKYNSYLDEMAEWDAQLQYEGSKQNYLNTLSNPYSTDKEIAFALETYNNATKEYDNAISVKKGDQFAQTFVGVNSNSTPTSSSRYNLGSNYEQLDSTAKKNVLKNLDTKDKEELIRSTTLAKSLTVEDIKILDTIDKNHNYESELDDINKKLKDKSIAGTSEYNRLYEEQQKLLTEKKTLDKYNQAMQNAHFNILNNILP